MLRGRALHALRVVAIAASVVGFNGVRPATHPRHASSPALPARSSAPLCAATAPPSASPPPDEISADAPLSVLVAGCGVGHVAECPVCSRLGDAWPDGRAGVVGDLSSAFCAAGGREGVFRGRGSAALSDLYGSLEM